jgi:hypothetical protein
MIGAVGKRMTNILVRSAFRWKVELKNSVFDVWQNREAGCPTLGTFVPSQDDGFLVLPRQDPGDDFARGDPADE